MRKLAEAELAVSDWADVIRQGAERRVGSHDAEAVVADAAYSQALALFRLVGNAAAAFTAHAEEIERGGR
ncbi:hypothetical protein [Amycolatopsis thermalba]|uniref:SAV-6107-like HEPN domain-containing protein n=1 Tax=Amycolatopsis thermalba TaxID=944492 RepID=A0ABY4NMQ0_9PSEU|nr:hypothetical protein [Amycolatopsis thermalba]OXM74547.1 hypothetical protein CF166_04290 [Amycolatopsis sp. KNN50.9b]UQS21760.1 hypothetical protein L1857_02430 [Amycolatopsis thermalba]